MRIPSTREYARIWTVGAPGPASGPPWNLVPLGGGWPGDIGPGCGDVLGKIGHEAGKLGPGSGRSGPLHPLAELLQGQPAVTGGCAQPLDGGVPLGVRRPDTLGRLAVPRDSRFGEEREPRISSATDSSPGASERFRTGRASRLDLGRPPGVLPPERRQSSPPRPPSAPRRTATACRPSNRTRERYSCRVLIKQAAPVLAHRGGPRPPPAER